MVRVLSRLYICLWILIHAILFGFGFWKQKSDPELRILNRIGYSVYTSRGAGLALALDASLLLLPTCRNFIDLLRHVVPYRYIPVDARITFHKWSAMTLLFFTMVHVNAHYTNFFQVQLELKLMKTWEVHYKTWAGLTGHLMLLIMLLMYTTAHAKVRKAHFELFFNFHRLAIVFYIVLFFHAFGCFVKSADTGQCKGYLTYAFALPGFLIFLLEQFVRVWRSFHPAKVTKVVLHSANTLELEAEKNTSITFQPGQYVFLCFPEISRWQWHPFTISSAPEEGKIRLHIRLVGDWTNSLSTHLTRRTMSMIPEKEWTCLIDGPYGAPTQYAFQYETIILVSAGIGITPAASILRALQLKYSRGSLFKTNSVTFYWVCREKEAFSWFHDLLLDVEAKVPKHLLEINTHLTGSLSKDDIEAVIFQQDIQDPVTDLKSKCLFGRPDWQKEIRKLKGRLGKNTCRKVGVFVCGPSSLIDTIQEACEQENLNMDFYKEYF